MNGAVPPPACAADPGRARPRERLLIRQTATLIYLITRPFARAYGLGAREWCRRRFAAVGDGVSFDPTTSVFSYEHITVGRDVFVGWGAHFFGQIEIGDDVMFGPKVHLMGGYHKIDAIGRTIRESGGAPWGRQSWWRTMCGSARGSR